MCSVAVTQPFVDCRLALTLEDQHDKLIETRQLYRPGRVEKRLERLIAAGELDDLGMGAPELVPDIDDGIGCAGCEFIEMIGDLRLDRS